MSRNRRLEWVQDLPEVIQHCGGAKGVTSLPDALPINPRWGTVTKGREKPEGHRHRAGYPLGGRVHSLAVSFSNTGPRAQSSLYKCKPNRLGEQWRVEEGRPAMNRNQIKTVLLMGLGGRHLHRGRS